MNSKQEDKDSVTHYGIATYRVIVRLICWLTLLLLLWQVAVSAAIVSYDAGQDINHPVHARQGMVVSADALATQVGVDILKQGGNAVDAAVAVGFALAVTYPQAGNIGGGGFMLLHLKDGSTRAIDFREMAPAKAQRDMFLDAKGNADSKLSLTSHLASGVPGTVAGLSLALKKYGSMPLQKVIQPAINLARNGFIVNANLARALDKYGREVMLNHDNSRKIFFNREGTPWREGDRLVQQALATSLQSIASQGPDAFYQGEIARQIVSEMERNGGLITQTDLAGYQAVEREPVMGTYKGYQIFSMPAPSSGGIHIIQILNILENFDLQSLGQNSAASIHLMATAMKHAYADRSEYLGDPDFVRVPTHELISKAYGRTLAQQISSTRVTPSTDIKPGKLTPYESEQTTHFSVADKEGNAVAVTYTLNTNFGSGIVAGNSGILLNNEMDDFSAKPGSANIYGLIGGEANSIQPFKRPLSSMSPTIVVKGGKAVLVTGSPGGSRIITTVLQILINTLDHKMNIAEASSAPRIHHQWLPDELRVEKGLSVDTINLLTKMGYQVSVQNPMGSTQSIVIGDNGFYGATDLRSQGALAAGY